MTSRRKLDAYVRRRDFAKTKEPRPDGARRKGGRRFVVHKHDATSLHYDFRLEFGGVLVSWAVPKGPSTDTRIKRLAIRTEDHPTAYVDFEGVIPEGEYGAGTVLVWDTGTYENLRASKGSERKSMQAALKDGLIEVFLHGKKLEGGYALKRTGGGKKPRWLMIKMRDEYADARRNPTHTEPDSVRSGRSLGEIAAEDADAAG